MSRILICITGPDGSGKTSIAKALIEDLAANRVDAGLLNIHAIADDLHINLSDIQRYLSQLKTQARFLFFCHVLQRAYDACESKIIITPGYWYKYAVTESFFGLNSSVVEFARRNLPQPQVTYFLECSPATAATRKSSFTTYETMGQPTASGFIHAQQKLEPFWQCIKEPQWRTVADMSFANKLDIIKADLKREGFGYVAP